MADKKLSFAIFGNDRKALELMQVWEMLDYLSKRNADVFIEETFYRNLCRDLNGDLPVAGVFEGNSFETDYAISLGGDGTFLRAASKVGAKNIPIIGVNMGRLGFLANVLPGEVLEMLDEIYGGNFDIEERSVIKLSTDSDKFRDYPFALNDIAILKRDTASMISIRVSVGGEYVVTYLADGLIISTPTGSTAYSLSNGGPIMVPRSGILSLTPVAPHSLNIRPIVIGDDMEIKLEVESRSHSFLAAIDGRSERVDEGTTVTIAKAPFRIRIVKRHNHRYFSTLRSKLMWGADSRE
ncbi:NAD kinase [Prevotella corporis]|uniref:NAD kinase n=1 Tax=Prevotella corporis TaxID=28128 RepID=UPI0023657018|nr:NAD kinase [Prevotella corporis]